MMKKILIIDDEADARLLIRQYLESYKDIEIIGEYDNGIDAVQAIDHLEPDWIFLDIQMPGLNGFEVLQKIKHIPRIIFSTAYESFALDAFNHNAVDYLLKPYSLSRFSNAISKLRNGDGNMVSIERLNENLPENRPYPLRFLLYYGNKLVGVNTKDIIWFEADRDYVKAHTAEKFYITSYGISILEQKLNPESFIRIHRSAIINIVHIKEVLRDIKGTFVVLRNGQIHKVGRTYLHAIKHLLV